MNSFVPSRGSIMNTPALFVSLVLSSSDSSDRIEYSGYFSRKKSMSTRFEASSALVTGELSLFISTSYSAFSYIRIISSDASSPAFIMSPVSASGEYISCIASPTRISAHSSADFTDVSRTMSAFVGISYGASTPVKFFISPENAFLYSPLGSRLAHSSTSAFM